MIKSLIMLLLFTAVLFSEQDITFLLGSGPRFQRNDMGIQVNSVGGQIGIQLNQKHIFSASAYYQNKENSTTDSDQQVWENDFKLYLCAYVSYRYLHSIGNWLKFGGGISGGFNICERDKNWSDKEFVLIEGISTPQKIQFRYSAESKFVSFGGPTLSVQLGYKRLFGEYSVIGSIGYRKNFGSMKSVDSLSGAITLSQQKQYEDVQLTSETTFDSSSSYLLRENKFSLEHILSLVLYF